MYIFFRQKWFFNQSYKEEEGLYKEKCEHLVHCQMQPRNKTGSGM